MECQNESGENFTSNNGVFELYVTFVHTAGNFRLNISIFYFCSDYYSENMLENVHLTRQVRFIPVHLMTDKFLTFWIYALQNKKGPLLEVFGLASVYTIALNYCN
jgi:hypothetical protein